MEGSRVVGLGPTSNLGDLYSALKTLDIRTRNQVRAILSDDGSTAVKLMNLLREKKSSRELTKIEKVLRAQAARQGNFVPELFPEVIQTDESYVRLSSLGITKQIEMVDHYVLENLPRLKELILLCNDAGRLILAKDFSAASKVLGHGIECFGNSLLFLRKAVLINTLNSKPQSTEELDRLLERAGAGNNNLIVSSLFNCYQDEHDILNIKRSILGLPSKGARNRFTRDIARIPFHPHAKNPEDLCALLQSSLQASLIDAVVILKVNQDVVDLSSYQGLSTIFSFWDKTGVSVEEVAQHYLEETDAEYLFYKHSSAWLENSDVVRYRTLQDHFYDVPEASYFTVTDELISRLSLWVNNITLKDLAKDVDLTRHGFSNLSKIEKSGYMTRSSLFNYLVHRSEGFEYVSEDDLISIMGRTSDLAKTINTDHVINLAANTSSQIAKIILYLLVARKSKRIGDSHRLRSLLQKIVKSSYDEDLVKFVDALSKKSGEVAEYTYEVCTEDFIAKLPHLIKSTAQITETRAALHKWMGGFKNQQAFLDRARNLLIDHQINRIRNEIDDPRIYVDAARFSEWINDELIRDLNTILTSLEHNQTLSTGDDPQLTSLVELAYVNFCSNNIFGIASYLGRRIRHGTFKGHLYSGVIAHANSPQYRSLMNDPAFADKWERWRQAYERSIDSIIRESIHVESTTKREGLLKPNLKAIGKREAAQACVKSLVKVFAKTKSTVGFADTLTDYCWRIVEIDLKNVNSFLKRQKANLINLELLSELRVSAPGYAWKNELLKEFGRDIPRLITDKLTAMNGWFKRPASVSPKASLSLLYKAVVAEVRESFPNFNVETDYLEETDLELVGGAYHVLYDAFYVVVYNAAKHGKANGKVARDFKIGISPDGRLRAALVTITSEIPDDTIESDVVERLKVKPEDDIVNAQVEEGRSGIRKLYQIASANENFKVIRVECVDRLVSIQVALMLEHL